ncbi:MAG TPA: HNH endonuclease signature motif containing protein [Methanospirillum sp.]|nr:HNH endonuclease signature motif containing protein [Methanospirillum sp.]
MANPYVPQYCLCFAQDYANLYVETILSKPELSQNDITALDFFFNTGHPVFTGAWNPIYTKFKDIESRLITAIRMLDESTAYTCRSIFATHLRIAFTRLSPLDFDADINRFIKELSYSELKAMDSFALEYVERRGIHRTYKNGVRSTTPYFAWTQQVKLRDRLCCKRCGSSKKPVAHHITPVDVAPELATDVNNGITLCEHCHKIYHHLRPVEQCHFKSLSIFIEGYRGRKE